VSSLLRHEPAKSFHVRKRKKVVLVRGWHNGNAKTIAIVAQGYLDLDEPRLESRSDIRIQEKGRCFCRQNSPVEDFDSKYPLNEYYHLDNGAALSESGFMDQNLLVPEII